MREVRSQLSLLWLYHHPYHIFFCLGFMFSQHLISYKSWIRTHQLLSYNFQILNFSLTLIGKYKKSRKHHRDLSKTGLSHWCCDQISLWLIGQDLVHLLSGTHLSTPLLPSVSFLPPKVLSSKYQQEEAGQFFNTLDWLFMTDCMASHRRDRITALLTQLSPLLFPLPPPFTFLLSLADYFPWSRQFCQLGRGPLLSIVSLSLPSYIPLQRPDLKFASMTGTTYEVLTLRPHWAVI